MHNTNKPGIRVASELLNLVGNAKRRAWVGLLGREHQTDAFVGLRVNDVGEYGNVPSPSWGCQQEQGALGVQSFRNAAALWSHRESLVSSSNSFGKRCAR
jgi:hypothetical protein